MAWKDWSYIKKSLLISFIIVVLSFLPFLEYALRGNALQCEPIPNLGGANAPYCVTMIFSLLLISGFIIRMGLIFLLTGASISGEMFPSSWILVGIISFIFYFLICTFIGWMIGKVKSKN